MADSALRDRRILVVEDEFLIAMSLQDALENAGAVVVGPAPSVEKAIKQIESEPHIDAAVLDVNLGRHACLSGRRHARRQEHSVRLYFGL